MYEQQSCRVTVNDFLKLLDHSPILQSKVDSQSSLDKMVSSLALSIVILLLTVVTCFLSHNISPISKIPRFQLFKKSEIEEALVRIKGMEGVEGYVICNNDGTVLRHQVDMTKKVADDLARVSLFYWIFRIVQRMQCCKFLLLLLHTTRLAPHTSSILTTHNPTQQESNQACLTSHQRDTRSRSK